MAFSFESSSWYVFTTQKKKCWKDYVKYLNKQTMLWRILFLGAERETSGGQRRAKVQRSGETTRLPCISKVKLSTNALFIFLYIYIYIYMCVCVCVCLSVCLSFIIVTWRYLTESRQETFTLRTTTIFRPSSFWFPFQLLKTNRKLILHNCS